MMKIAGGRLPVHAGFGRPDGLPLLDRIRWTVDADRRTTTIQTGAGRADLDQRGQQRDVYLTDAAGDARQPGRLHSAVHGRHWLLVEYADRRHGGEPAADVEPGLLAWSTAAASISTLQPVDDELERSCVQLDLGLHHRQDHRQAAVCSGYAETIPIRLEQVRCAWSKIHRTSICTPRTTWTGRLRARSWTRVPASSRT